MKKTTITISTYWLNMFTRSMRDWKIFFSTEEIKSFFTVLKNNGLSDGHSFNQSIIELDEERFNGIDCITGKSEKCFNVTFTSFF